MAIAKKTAAMDPRIPNVLSTCNAPNWGGPLVGGIILLIMLGVLGSLVWVAWRWFSTSCDPGLQKTYIGGAVYCVDKNKPPAFLGGGNRWGS